MGKFSKQNYKIMFDWWFKEIDNPVLKFICLWITFNQWYKTNYNELDDRLTDKGYLEKIKKDYSIYHFIFYNKGTLEPKLYKTLSQIIRVAEKMKFKNNFLLLKDSHDPDHNSRLNHRNFGKLLDLIYETRNTVFHGDVRISNKDLEKLTRNLNNFFKIFLIRVIQMPFK